MYQLPGEDKNTLTFTAVLHPEDGATGPRGGRVVTVTNKKRF